MFERRIGDGGADRRIGQRIDRSRSVARFARPNQLALHIRWQLGGRTVHADGRLARGLRAITARCEIEPDAPETLRNDVRACLKADVEEWQDHLTRLGRVTPRRNHVEGDGRDELIRRFLARSAQAEAIDVTLFDGLNNVMSPVPAGIPGIGQALRRT